MSLIPSPRHSADDLAVWARLERLDRLRVLQGSRRMDRLESTAMGHIREFLETGPAWVGTSWGKDSVVVAHLARRVDPEIPVCWVVTPKWETPECWAVRDAFNEAHPGLYREYSDHELPISVDGGTGLPVALINDAEDWPPVQDFGPRYITGVRSEESASRKSRQRRYGVASKNTCAPITTWRGDDVFAYLCRYDLPIHPAYAMSRGGLLDRRWLRVAPLGGIRGIGMGRRQWERHYYEDIISRLESGE